MKKPKKGLHFNEKTQKRPKILFKGPKFYQKWSKMGIKCSNFPNLPSFSAGSAPGDTVDIIDKYTYLGLTIDND